MATLSDERFSRLKVLIVDDISAMRSALRQQLDQIAIRKVDQAASSEEALRMVQNNRYDLILCDYYLGESTDGQQLLEHMRALRLLPPTTLFFIVTAESTYDFVSRAGECAPDDYLIKPFTASILATRLERLFERQEALSGVNGRIAAKDLAGAVAECDAVLLARSKFSMEALKLKGSTLLELGLHTEAKAAYAQALAVRAGIPWAELGFARALKAAGQFEEAKEAAVAVLAQNPQFVAAYDLLAAVQEEQGDPTAALKTLKQSEIVVPSVRRARLIGEAAYRSGDLIGAAAAYSKVLAATKNSMTKADTDHASLAQVFVDQGEPEKAMKVLVDAKGSFEGNSAFAAVSGAIEAQACVKLGDLSGAQAALTRAMALVSAADGEKATLALSKACFASGRDAEGAAMLAQAVRADHEDTRMLALARKVLIDTGHEALVATIVDSHAQAATSIVEQAHALARQSKFDDAIAIVLAALEQTPSNTGLLLCCAQVHLLSLSQKGLNLDHVTRVKGYLSSLERLMPGHARVNKMQAFFRDTVGKASKRA